MPPTPAVLLPVYRYYRWRSGSWGQRHHWGRVPETLAEVLPHPPELAAWAGIQVLHGWLPSGGGHGGGTPVPRGSSSCLRATELKSLQGARGELLPQPEAGVCVPTSVDRPGPRWGGALLSSALLCSLLPGELEGCLCPHPYKAMERSI